MTTFKRPMLAAPLLKPSDLHTDEVILAAMQKLRYPVLATVKLDGIRAVKIGGKLSSRTLKPIPNKSIQARATKLPEGFDMELWAAELSFEEISSIVMSEEHECSDKIEFHVLDKYDCSYNYSQRIQIIKQWSHEYVEQTSDIKIYCPVQCNDSKMLRDYFFQIERLNGEGICFRTPDSPYKQGRSTLKEQYLVKLCRFLTAEATIIEFEEALENSNCSKYNAVGLMDRASHQHNLHPKNMLGALVVRDRLGREFKVGSGFTDKQRREIWLQRDKYLGKQITYKSKGGEKTLPRCPIFKGFREEEF